jgi:hypothetical protein
MPSVLDLFCGVGGAAEGYYNAGFDVVGVDVAPQPDYPFMFIQQDALELLRGNLSYVNVFDFVHASPPCPAYSALNAVNKREYPKCIEEVRELLRASGVPYVIENVNGAPLIDPVVLCGEMFGLDVLRHRKFETNWNLPQPEHKAHRGRVRGWRHGVYFDGPYVAVYGKGGGKATLSEAQKAMGIDWTDNYDSIKDAIPPAYTEYVGKSFLASALVKETA